MLASILLLIGTLSTPQPLTAVRIQDGPSIDGVLDDSVWLQTETVCCRLMQYGPEYGSEMTEETEISILYNDSHIYFAFSMNDPDPTTMLNALTPRDNYVTGEWIAILLDTWGDGREATSFEISLANSQMDSKINPHGRWDYSWDAVWESGSRVTDEGWTAEFAIPFSCLRFDQTSDAQSWTVNFQRILGKTRENGWYVLSDGGPMADLETFADLNGIEGIEGSLGLEIRPYASERSINDSEQDEWDNTFNAGVDMKLGIGSSIAADFTVNPDFGQIEADAVEMNLSHFELFLREKRPFFLESQNIFEMPFMMFYSRRIGAVASNGDVIPIIGGGKISGSLGSGFRFGFLDAVTARVSEDTLILVPAVNYGIFRTVKEFGAFSYIGISAVSRESWKQDEFDAEHNTALALDGAFEIPGNHILSLAAARSWNTGLEDDGAYEIEFNKIRSRIGYESGFRYVGENFNVNATGFTTENGFWESWGHFWHNIRPEETFSEIGYNGGVYYAKQLHGEVTAQNVNLSTHATLMNGMNFGIEGNYSGEYFDPYEGPEGHAYSNHADFYGWLGTNHFDPLYGRVGFGAGQWESGGTFRNYQATFRFRPSAALTVGLEGNMFNTDGGTNYNWEISDWDIRDTYWKSLILRVNYIFNPDMHLRLFSQYSRFLMDYTLTGESESSDITANILFSWQYLPGSMFYFLVENLFEENEEGSFGTPDIGFYAKLTWYLPI